MAAVTTGDVERIMAQIRSRIAEKRNEDYTEEQIRELATVKLEGFLDPSNLRSGMVEFYQKHLKEKEEALRQISKLQQIPEAPQLFEFDPDIIYRSSRGVSGRILYTIRRVLNPLLKFFFKNMHAIPIAGAREDEELMRAAFDKVDEELAAGNVVCIFPEGGITRDGEIQRFRPGIEKIIERRSVPVVPVALGHLWGSWFSRRRDGGLRKIPGRLFAQVPVRFGEPVPPSEVTAAKLELLVRTLRGDER